MPTMLRPDLRHSLYQQASLRQNNVLIEPAKPYWRLQTEAGSRNTEVRFYDATDQLLYQETMSHQYVRLTPRNMARLDAILDRLVGGKLVASSLKVKPIDEMPTETELNNRAEYARQMATPTETNRKGYPIQAYSHYQPKQNRLIVLVTNPDRHKMKISLWQEGRTPEAYGELDYGPHYQQKLNLQNLPNGSYTLIVSSMDGNFRYTKPFTFQR